MCRAAQLSRQAALMDGEGWRRTAQECGRTPAIWEYTEYKLVDVLEHKKRLGPAGHAFWQYGIDGNQPTRYGFIYAAGCSESEQSQPYCPGGIKEWWPVIWIEIPGEVWPMYCPALAWQGGRPWFGHFSRLWQLPWHWIPDTTPSTTSAVPVSDAASEALSDSSFIDVAMSGVAASDTLDTSSWVDVAEDLDDESVCAASSSGSTGCSSSSSIPWKDLV